jgi:hypothetical protein
MLWNVQWSSFNSQLAFACTRKQLRQRSEMSCSGQSTSSQPQIPARHLWHHMPEQSNIWQPIA